MSREKYKNDQYFDEYIKYERSRVVRFSEVLNSLKNSEESKIKQCERYIASFERNIVTALYSHGESKAEIKEEFLKYLDAIEKSAVADYAEMADLLAISILLEISEDKLKSVLDNRAFDDSLIKTLKEYLVSGNVIISGNDLKYESYYKMFWEYLKADDEISTDKFINYINTEWYLSCKDLSWYDSHESKQNTYVGYWCWIAAALLKMKNENLRGYKTEYIPVELLKRPIETEGIKEMPDRRQQLINVFQDTLQFCRENVRLAAAVTYGRENTRLYEADDYPELSDFGRKAGRIQVTGERSFEAAMRLHGVCPDQKIGVLNFASAIRPGGGVANGCTAQEESLCRCSTLYFAIDCEWLWEKYYQVNRRLGDIRHSDACIYSPEVIICKTDESVPRRMDERNFVTVDIITCAAPDLRNEPFDWNNPETGMPVKMEPGKLYDLHVRRAEHILHVAAANGVEILILGAFGCGAFQNDPYVVAKAYKTALKKYGDRFDRIVFAIYYSERETVNFRAFREEFES